MNDVAISLAHSTMPNLEADAILDASKLQIQSPQDRATYTRRSANRQRRGYFGIGIEKAKTPVNLGTLWRSASLFNADFIFTIGCRYKPQCSDTMRTHRHTPLFTYPDFEAFYSNLPYDCQLVGVELTDSAIALPRFQHPERAIYLLGAEDHGLSPMALSKCHHIVQIPSALSYSMNVAVAGSILMFDRFTKKSEGEPKA